MKRTNFFNELGVYLRKVTLKNIVWIFLFSLVLSTCFFTYINAFVEKMIPETNMVVTITQPSAVSSEVWIYMVNSKEISKEQFDSMEKTGAWEFRSAIEWSYGDNTIISTGANVGSTITIPIKRAPYGGINIWCQAYSGAIDVKVDGKVTHYDLYNEKGSYLQITPFADSMLSIMITIVVYFIIALIMAFMIIMLIPLINQIFNHVPVIKYHYAILVAVLFVCIYIFDIIWYRSGITNFNAFGDQPYYWDVGKRLAGSLTAEMFNELAQKTIACFRGYGNFVPSFLANFVGTRLGIDPYIIYFAFPSMMAALLFGYILPRLYEALHGSRVHILQIVLSFFGFFFFFKGNLASIDGDIFGVTLYLMAALFALLALQKAKIKYAIGSGLSLSFCLAIRTSYLIGSVILIFLLIILVIVQMLKKEASGITFAQVKMKRTIILLISFAISFLIVCIPQIGINNIQGHSGLLAYDRDGAYRTASTNLLEQGMDSALQGYVTGYPYPVGDDQIYAIKKYSGYLDSNFKEMTMAQCLDAYAKAPLDTFIAILKRLVAIIDIKTNVTLPAEQWSMNTKFYLFSTFNYILIAVALYTLLNRKLRKSVYKGIDLAFWGILVVGPVAPLMASIFEWRHAMIEFIFIIAYACSYAFIGCMYDKERKEIIVKSNIWPFITCVVCGIHVISLTMYH